VGVYGEGPKRLPSAVKAKLSARVMLEVASAIATTAQVPAFVVRVRLLQHDVYCLPCRALQVRAGARLFRMMARRTWRHGNYIRTAGSAETPHNCGRSLPCPRLTAVNEWCRIRNRSASHGIRICGRNNFFANMAGWPVEAPSQDVGGEGEAGSGTHRMCLLQAGQR